MLFQGGVMETAEIRWIGKQEFVAKGPSGHAVVLDADRGSNVGCGPMELLLLALGSCTATDLVIILEKKQEKLEGLEVICWGQRAKEPPRVWTKMELLFRVRGEVTEDSVKKAIALSEDKYCSVWAMLGKTAAISWRYEIVKS
jgi:putative redox protein